MHRPPVPAPPLIDLLTSSIDGAALAPVPVAASQVPAAPAASGAALRRMRHQLGVPVLAAGRAVLRSPRVRQLALRVLKRFPGLYARAYRMMMAPGAGAAGSNGGAAQDPALSPREAFILGFLRAPQEAPSLAHGRRPRLALVSPMPPERTGVATYAVELLGHLCATFDVELVLAQAELTLPPSLAGLPTHSTAWFAEHGAEFDQVLYQVGNSPFHSHMFVLLARHPGVVVLHDFFLGGALAHAQMSGAAPRAWTEALFHAHGYGAVRASEDPQRNAQAHKDWPCSLGVLEAATRVIVHSQHARQLARDWYGAIAAHNIDVIPHPRTPPEVIDRQAARKALGIADDCFLVCSFGFIAPNKLTHDLLRAWLGSQLHADARCTLVLVGANHDSPYGVQVEELIRGAGPDARIRIAGWTDQAEYRQYLQAADIGVQLRTNAHGESSGAVLDCLNYGLATIVNANGSMAEFPDDAVWRLPDAFRQHELTAALESLRRNLAQRQAFGQRALALMDAGFRPAGCTRQYLVTLAQAQEETAASQRAWRAALEDAAPADDAALRRLAASLAALPGTAPHQRQLLVDVTALDALAAAQLHALLDAQRPGLRIEPVWLDTSGPTPRYRQARNATGQLLGLAWPAQSELLVDVDPGDIFYAPDAASASVEAAIACGLLAAWRTRGVAVNLLVRDVDAADRYGAHADRLLCFAQPHSVELG